MKRGLVSYKRGDDDDDEPTSSSSLVSHTTPSSSISDKDISHPKSTISENQEHSQTNSKSNPSSSSPASSITSSNPISCTESTHKNNNGIQDDQEQPVKSIDYSSWRKTPRPPPIYSPEVSKLINWAQTGKSINYNLRSSKEFHNPDILMGLVQITGIKEFGTNYPPHLTNPNRYIASDHHRQLIKAQESQLEARIASQQPGKRTAIDFVKRPASSNYASNPPDAKRFKRQ